MTNDAALPATRFAVDPGTNGNPIRGLDRNAQPGPVAIPDLAAIKAKQKATWEAGDFGQIAHTIENVAEEFMAQQPLPRGSHVLDVACGTGNLAVIAARHGCEVWGIDIARNLICQARLRAAVKT